MDAESVMAELCELRPSEFTAARDVYVAQARTEEADSRCVGSGVTGPPTSCWGSVR